jgi:hypothetical protein
VRSLAIIRATTADMKLIASHAPLKRLELEYPEAGEIGLAYLARKGTLEELVIRDELTLDEIHQISRMNLRMLRIDGTLSDSRQASFERLASMKNLRELQIASLEIEPDGLFVFKAFEGGHKLDRLRLEGSVAHGWEFMVAHRIPTRRLELQLEGKPYTRLSEAPEDLVQGQNAKLLEELRLELTDAYFEPGDMDEQHVAGIKSYPNLKRIEVRRGGFESPTQQDLYIEWLKESLPGVEVVLAP